MATLAIPVAEEVGTLALAEAPEIAAGAEAATTGLRSFLPKVGQFLGSSSSKAVPKLAKFEAKVAPTVISNVEKKAIPIAQNTIGKSAEKAIVKEKEKSLLKRGSESLLIGGLLPGLG